MLTESLVYNETINYSRDQVLIGTDGWTAGQYNCTIMLDNQTVLSERITIVK